MECVDIDTTNVKDEIALSSHLRCCFHTLSLVATSDPKTAIMGAYGKLHHGVFAKCSSLWNCAGRPKSSEVIKRILDCQLRLPCSTRWNSLYDSLMALLKHKKLNDLMIALALPSFREAEVEFIKEYAMILQPIAVALDRLQSDQICLHGCLCGSTTIACIVT